MARFLVSFFVLLVLACATEACRCAQRHPQTYFCESDFVILAKVLNKKTIEDGQTFEYKLNISKVFKKTDEANCALRSKRVYSSSSGASCGAFLEDGQKYVMSGSAYDGKANINSCGFIRQWSEITDYQKLGFKTEYENACSCTVESCFTPETCAEAPADNVCKLKYENSECFFKESTCAPDEDGKCNWTGSDLFAQCQV